MIKKSILLRKLFSYFFIVILTLSHFSNIQIDDNVYTSQNIVNKSHSIIRCEDENAICIDAILNTKLTSDYIQTLNKKAGTNTYRFSKKTNGLTFFSFPNWAFIYNEFLLKKYNRVIYYVATTFSMRWIIQYIHYKNGVKHLVSSVFS